MATTTNIEWTEKTWNPVVGCSMCSPGCAQCYAETMSKRLAAMALADLAKGRDPGRKRHYLNVIHDGGRSAGRFNGVLEPVPEALTDPLTWRKPATVFVNSMSDLFHEAVPFAFIDKVFAVMALCPQHTFQVLTKRPERMAEYLTSGAHQRSQDAAATANWITKGDGWRYSAWTWPIPSVWLGCSPVDQTTLDEYVPHLLRTPAAVRFLSIEPMLGAMKIACPHATATDGTWEDLNLEHVSFFSPFAGFKCRKDCHVCYGKCFPQGIHWVILGCESLPGGRVGRNADHVNDQMADVVRQCRSAGVPVFVKQVNRAGRVEHDMEKFPEALRVREYPVRVGTVTA